MAKEQAEQKVNQYKHLKGKTYLLRSNNERYELIRVDAMGIGNEYETYFVVKPLSGNLIRTTPSYTLKEFLSLFSEL